MKNIKLNLGKNIKTFRELKGYSQMVVASELGISQQAFQKLESGENKIDLYRANKIAEFLQIDLEVLINFNPNIYIKPSNNSTLKNEEEIDLYKLIEHLEKQIEYLTSEVTFFKNQNSKLLSIIEKSK